MMLYKCFENINLGIKLMFILKNSIFKTDKFIWNYKSIVLSAIDIQCEKPLEICYVSFNPILK